MICGISMTTAIRGNDGDGAMKTESVSVIAALLLFACTSGGGGSGDAEAPVPSDRMSSPTTDVIDDPGEAVDAANSVDTMLPATDPVDPTTRAPVSDNDAGERRCVTGGDISDDEVVVWHALNSDAESRFDELVARYNEMPDRPIVRTERRGNYTETVQALAATDPVDWPDVVMADHRSVQVLADSHSTVPPDECDGGVFDDLVPVIGATYSLDGVLQAVPFNVSTPVLMFDLAKVRGAGLDPASPPATLAQLSEAATAVVDAGGSDFGFVAYDHFGAWFVRQFDAKRGVVTGATDNGRAGEPVVAVDFTRPEIVESYEWLLDEITAGRALWIGGNPSGIDDLLRLVDPVADATYTISTSGAVGEVLRVVESGSFGDVEVGVAPMPGPAPGGSAGGGAFWMVDGGDTARVGAAFDFLSWLVEPAQHAEFSAYTGFSPVRDAELDDGALAVAWAEHPQLRVGYDQLRSLPGDVAHAGPAWGPGDDITSLLYATLTRIVDGNDAVEELALATEQANALIAEYNASRGA